MGTVYPQVVAADPNVDVSFGIVGNDILPTAGQNFGLITCLGFMFNMNTSPWPVDTLLYSDASGNLSSVSLGDPVARVIAQDIAFGVLYVFAASQMISEGDIAWNTTGNNTQPGEFLGTNTAQDLRFRTAGAQKMVLDQGGHLGVGEAAPTHIFEYKTHANANASSIQHDTWYVETASNGYSTAIAVPVSDPSVMRMEFTANCRGGAGAAHASFKRSAVFYREAGNVQIQGPSWASDFTQKSDFTLNVRFILGISSVTLQVQPSSNSLHKWSGSLKMQQIF